MGIAWPTNTEGCAAAIPFALWITRGERMKVEPDNPKSNAERYTLDFVPFGGAFVACVQTTDSGKSVVIDPKRHVRFGRADEYGWVFKRELANIGDEDSGQPNSWQPLAPDETKAWPALALFGKLPGLPPIIFGVGDSPCADSRLLAGMPNEKYALFCTLNKKLFSRFVDELMKRPDQALLDSGVRTVVVKPFGEPAPFPNIGLLDEEQCGKVRRLLFTGENRGYHWGRYFKSHRTPAIFDVTPPSLRGLYATEWLQWCCETVLEKDWPFLLSQLSVIHAANAGAPIPDLAQKLPTTGPMAGPAAAMRKYAYEYAKRGGRRRGLIVGALNVSSGPGADAPGTLGIPGWRTAARLIESDFAIRHPARDEKNLDTYFFSDEQRDALLAYYDMYALGFDHGPDRDAIEAHWNHGQEVLGWVRNKQKAILDSVRHDDLWRDAELTTPPDETSKRIALHGRFTFQSAALGYKFWETAHAALDSQSDWDRFLPYLSWMQEDAGTLAAVFQEFIEHHLREYDIEAESLEKLLNYLYRYELVLRSKSVTAPLGKSKVTVVLEPDPVSGRVHATMVRDAKPKSLGRFELLSSVVDLPTQDVHEPFAPTNTRARRRNYKRALRSGQRRTFQRLESTAEVLRLESKSQFALALNVISESMGAAIALSKLVAELKSKAWSEADVGLYTEAAESTFMLFEPGKDLLKLLFRKAQIGSTMASPFLRGAGALGKTGGAIEAARNTLTGMRTLDTLLTPHTSQTDLAKYLDRGETVPAWLEGVKGLVQVGTGAAGMQILCGATTAIATLSLGVWVAIGSVTLATLDVLIYSHTGGAGPVDAFLDKVREARINQLRINRDGRILLPKEEYTEQEPLELGAKGGPAHSLLSRQLGALNEVAKAYVKA